MLCIPGYYCGLNTRSANQNPCPVGTYNNETHRASVNGCMPCLGGMYCDQPGLEWPAGLCNAGTPNHVLHFLNLCSSYIQDVLLSIVILLLFNILMAIISFIVPSFCSVWIFSCEYSCNRINLFLVSKIYLNEFFVSISHTFR